MTTDKELLELAAKAAGMEHMRWASPDLGMVRMLDPTRQSETGSIGPSWNPLTDDGDALRLAVMLCLDMSRRTNMNGEFVIAERRDICFCPEPIDTNPRAATRRAITRAAAEIGRAMPSTTPDHSALRALCEAAKMTEADYAPLTLDDCDKFGDLASAFKRLKHADVVLALLDEIAELSEENKDMNDDLALHREELIKIHRENKAMRALLEEAIAYTSCSAWSPSMTGDIQDVLKGTK